MERKNSDFSIKKSGFIEKYQLSNNAFTRAIRFIENHREFAGNIGIDSDISIFNTDIITKIVSNCKSRKPAAIDKPTNDIANISDIVINNNFPEHAFFQTIKDSITIEDVIKLETVFICH